VLHTALRADVIVNVNGTKNVIQKFMKRKMKSFSSLVISERKKGTLVTVYRYYIIGIGA
jgi:hypothetical protein